MLCSWPSSALRKQKIALEEEQGKIIIDAAKASGVEVLAIERFHRIAEFRFRA
jgi:hypothetical protein